jgi:hypothetical protein
MTGAVRGMPGRDRTRFRPALRAGPRAHPGALTMTGLARPCSIARRGRRRGRGCAGSTITRPWPRCSTWPGRRARDRVLAHHRGHGVLDDGRPAVARVVEIERPELGRGVVEIERSTLARGSTLASASSLGRVVEIERSRWPSARSWAPWSRSRASSGPPGLARLGAGRRPGARRWPALRAGPGGRDPPWARSWHERMSVPCSVVRLALLGAIEGIERHHRGRGGRALPRGRVLAHHRGRVPALLGAGRACSAGSPRCARITAAVALLGGHRAAVSLSRCSTMTGSPGRARSLPGPCAHRWPALLGGHRAGAVARSRASSARDHPGPWRAACCSPRGSITAAVAGGRRCSAGITGRARSPGRGGPFPGRAVAACSELGSVACSCVDGRRKARPSGEERASGPNIFTGCSAEKLPVRMPLA